MRIIFLGTPDFSVPSLDAIVKAGHEVVAVVTMPDKPAGRGMQLQQSAVKKYAVENNIKVLQPVKLKDPEFIAKLQTLNADLQVVIAFRMLPQIVWQMPKFGTLNLHASLLPDYRGAAPINWAIINGETKTGVSTFFLKHEIDTGDVLLTKEVAITPTMNAGELHDLLMQVGAETIVKSLALIEIGNTKGTPQGDDNNKMAPKIFKEHCLINFNQNGQNIYNLIRGLSPYPAAFTYFDNKILKVYESSFEATNHQEPIGKMMSDNKTFLKVACQDGYIHLLQIQLEGKKRMKIDEFLRGNKV
ncbi:MAG: methionyl-tRNA formyltransferase [Candidatus Methylacidiphilales bacterium]